MKRLKYIKSACTASLALLYCFNTLAINRMPQFQTTRLKSTGGAGAGALLVDEATVLNPAPLAFFNMGSIHLQKMDTTSNYDKNSALGKSEQESEMLSVIATDTKSTVKGSARFINQEYIYNKRKQFAVSVAKAAGKKSAFGMTYIHTKDEVSEDSYNFDKQKYNQTVFGVSHVLSPQFSFGLVFIDPLKARPQETRAILGLQYNYQDFFSFMLDGGSDYNNRLSQNVQWRTALQIKLLNDFYVRAGIYNDKAIMEKGNGAGIGWLQPKLNLEIAIVSRDLLESDRLNQTTEDVKETSFSLSYRF